MAIQKWYSCYTNCILPYHCINFFNISKIHVKIVLGVIHQWRHAFFDHSRPALSNPFATRHMWRMTLFLNTSKLISFWKMVLKVITASIWFYTFLLKNQTVSIRVAQDISFSSFFKRFEWTHQVVLVCLKNVANEQTYLPQMWRTSKYCWTSLF